jgi:hypothetical protein
MPSLYKPQTNRIAQVDLAKFRAYFAIQTEGPMEPGAGKSAFVSTLIAMPQIVVTKIYR